MVRVMFLAQLLHNFNNFFLRSIIKYLGPTCRKTNPMVDHKKKIVRVMQELCKNHYSNNNFKSYLIFLMTQEELLALLFTMMHFFFLF